MAISFPNKSLDFEYNNTNEPGVRLFGEDTDRGRERGRQDMPAPALRAGQLLGQPSTDDRYRLQDEARHLRRQAPKNADLGHGRPGALQHPNRRIFQVYLNKSPTASSYVTRLQTESPSSAFRSGWTRSSTWRPKTRRSFSSATRTTWSSSGWSARRKVGL